MSRPTTVVIDWEVPGTDLDALCGDGATRIEKSLPTVTGLVGVGVLAAYAATVRFDWSWWQYLIAAVITADLVGGVVALSLNSSKRFRHADSIPVARPTASLVRNEVLFTAVHVYPIVVAVAFPGATIWWGLAWYAVPLIAVITLARVPLYLVRPAASIAIALTPLITVATPNPPGFAWLPAVMIAKLVLGGIREEPYRPTRGNIDAVSADAAPALTPNPKPLIARNGPHGKRSKAPIRPAHKTDIAELSRVLARAFHDDPVMMWMLPDPTARARALPMMFAAMTRHHYLPGGGAEVVSQDCAIAGSTLWDPPGRWKTSRREALLMMPTVVRAFRSRVQLAQTVMRTLIQNHPAQPHWYLTFIGTDPSVRGTGLGQALMRSRLERCDDDHAPAYLEATKPDLISFYSRFGFEVTGEIRLPNGPKLWPMWRNPR